MFHKILVANDGSEGAKRAVQVAVEVAKRHDAELHQLSVEEHLPHYAATVGEVVEAKQEAAEYFRKVIKEAEFVALAHHGFDLLVIGFMGHSKVFGRIWGSTSQNLAKLSPCSVLIVK